MIEEDLAFDIQEEQNTNVKAWVFKAEETHMSFHFDLSGRRTEQNIVLYLRCLGTLLLKVVEA